MLVLVELEPQTVAKLVLPVRRVPFLQVQRASFDQLVEQLPGELGPGTGSQLSRIS
jgi:hypothetical protein